MIVRRVVAEHDHFYALQSHDAISLGPASVIADAHAHDAAQRAPNRQSELARLEVALFQMLEASLRSVIGVAGQVHFAVFADDAARFVDQNGRVEAVFAPALLDQLGIADAEGNAEPLGLFEQADRLRAGHFGFEEAVDLALLREKPARKESGESELGKNHQIAAAALGLAQKLFVPAY